MIDTCGNNEKLISIRVAESQLAGWNVRLNCFASLVRVLRQLNVGIYRVNDRLSISACTTRTLNCFLDVLCLLEHR
jgi:hypothetical protein